MGGVWSRLKLAFAAFFTILFKSRLPMALQRTPVSETPAEVATSTTAPADEPDRAVQLISLFQRDGRLVDFLMEDVSAYSDAQIGAAVRDVHDACRRVLDRYVSLEPVFATPEGQPATVADPIDAAAIRLVGNVTGRPPFRGTVLHRGWRATRIELPPLASPAARRIVAQAEIEVA